MNYPTMLLIPFLKFEPLWYPLPNFKPLLPSELSLPDYSISIKIAFYRRFLSTSFNSNTSRLFVAVKSEWKIKKQLNTLLDKKSISSFDVFCKEERERDFSHKNQKKPHTVNITRYRIKITIFLIKDKEFSYQ